MRTREQEEMERMRADVMFNRADISQAVSTCPHCTGVSHIRHLLQDYYVACGTCGASGGTAGTVDEAVAKWERRA
jgi:hypothetical protein